MKSRRMMAAAAAVVMATGMVACGSDSSSTATTAAAPETTAAPDTTPAPETTAATPDTTEAAAPDTTEAAPADTTGGGLVEMGLTLDAPAGAAITVDGDAADWADIPGLDLTLAPITEESEIESKDSTVKIAQDGTNVYALVQISDDYNWNPDDPNLSGAVAIEWAIDSAAGTAMGGTNADEDTSLGMVDIWHWKLACESGVMSGGSTGAAPAEGKGPGSDGTCFLDDEYSTIPTERNKDDQAGAENSLAGMWSHSDPTADAAGMWTFEFSRPLDTADSTDAIFAAGGTAQLAVAYWDPDNAPEGWSDNEHVLSANMGWITVNFAS